MGLNLLTLLGDIAPGVTQTVALSVTLDPWLLLVGMDNSLEPTALLTYTLRAGSTVADAAPADNVERP